jgi:hypothetical protein
MSQIKHISILQTLFFIILGTTNSYGQLNTTNWHDIVARESKITDDTLLLYEYKYYFDPFYNAILRNTSFSSCWDEDEAHYCFWIQERKINSNSKIINYYNKDTIIIASGYMVNERPHGVFKIYCPSFPHCGINEIQDHSIVDIVYFKGKILAKFFYNEDEILARKKSILFGRKTRTVFIGEISDKKARIFFKRNAILDKKIRQ